MIRILVLALALALSLPAIASAQDLDASVLLLTDPCSDAPLNSYGADAQHINIIQGASSATLTPEEQAAVEFTQWARSVTWIRLCNLPTLTPWEGFVVDFDFGDRNGLALFQPLANGQVWIGATFRETEVM